MMTSVGRQFSRCAVPVRFFFSSRRRHTRCSRDWSSDVCSSDLNAKNLGIIAMKVTGQEFLLGNAAGKADIDSLLRYSMSLPVTTAVVGMPTLAMLEIGRASCRERV